MHVLTIIGNRPQFVKLAAVSPLLRREHEETVVHTGQHHDRELSAIFFEQLGLPDPDIDLGVSGGSNSDQTARMLAALGPVIAEREPDAVVVYGDTNSTLAGALAAVQNGVPCVHVEAGLRSFDRSMPEEVNRVLCDAVCDLLLAPSETAVVNLGNEGVHGTIVQTGDVMGDVVLALAGAAPHAEVLAAHGLTEGEYLLVTAHRAANVDDPERLERLVELVESLERPVIFPLHPRTRERLASFGLAERLAAVEGLRLTPPVGYLETIALAACARAVLTDSGGLQKEACWLGTQCLTMRDRTEWTETVASGWNTLVDLDAAAVADALAKPPPDGDPTSLYGAGSAGAEVVAAIGRLGLRRQAAPVESAS